MNFKLTTVSAAVLSALVSGAVVAEEVLQKQTDETMTVTGRTFDDYKVDHAVGALRTDATLLETPQSVTVIPEIVLDEQLASTLGDALQNDASVSPGTKKWNREVFSLRGFELSSSNGYLRNGHAQFSHYMQPIETLERVEVLKGPSGMLYGSSDAGGLINMVTKKPTHESQVSVGADMDDNGSMRYQIDASGALNESGSVRGRTVLVKQDTKSYREFINGDAQERDRYLGYAVIEADLTDDLLLSVHYERTHDDAQLDTGAWLDADGNRIGSRKLIRDAPWAFIDNNVQNAGADLTYHVNTDWTLTASYNYQNMTRHRRDSMPTPTDNTTVDGSYELRPFDRFDTWQHHTFHFDANGHFDALGVQHNTLFGVNGQFSSYKRQFDGMGRNEPGLPVGSDGMWPDYPGYDYRKNEVDNRSESSYYGFYAQDLMTFNDSWQGLIGLRYDRNQQDTLNADGSVALKNANDGDAWSPKVGVIYHPAYNGTIYASYARSFEYNPINVLDDGSQQVFEPTYSTQYELGTKWELLDNRLLLTGAIFDIEKDGILVSDRDSSNQSILVPGGSQRHRGAEVGAQGSIGDKWFVMASAMYLDAEYKNNEELTGKTPGNVPEWSGSAWTRYSVTNNTALNLGMVYQGERWADRLNTIKLDSYARFDAGASHTLKSGDVIWDFRFNIENLFDKEYVVGTGNGTVGDHGVLTDVHYGDERRFKLSVNASF
ncbi:ferrichrome-iron receptor [Vibrio maritimus]|uniref:Ferrichrome-iron receptor n=1 Tax=Vibrio maritimus TaxID=990268 RepID=A0A090RQD7_9VIBR|nr:ferrichrome-iron receptor [Vibrio maritimus]